MTRGAKRACALGQGCFGSFEDPRSLAPTRESRTNLAEHLKSIAYKFKGPLIRWVRQWGELQAEAVQALRTVAGLGARRPAPLEALAAEAGAFGHCADVRSFDMADRSRTVSALRSFETAG
jgi:hypothetical protein